MKKLVIAAGVVVAGCAIAPKFIAGTIESEYQNVAELVSKNPQITMTSEFTSTGWFSSTVNSTYEITFPDPEIGTISITSEEQMQYGPVIFSDDGVKFALSYSKAKLGLEIDGLQEEIPQEIIDSVNEHLHLTSMITYGLDAKSFVRMDEIKKDIDGDQLHIKPLVGEFTVQNYERMFGNMTWQGATISSDDGNVEIGEVTFNSDQTVLGGDIYYENYITEGDMELLLKSVDATSQSNPMSNVNLKNLRMTVDSRVNDKVMEAGVVYKLDEITAAGQTAKNATFDMLFANFDVEVMRKLGKQMSNMGMSADPEQQMAEITQLFTDNIDQLLASKPEIKIRDLSVEMPAGVANSEMTMHINETMFDKNNPMSLMIALASEGSLSVDQSLIAAYGMQPMVDMYVEQQMATIEDGKVKTTFTFGGGQLMVNGKPVPLQ